jgi:ketosteroid isomerase-like protein
MPESVQVPAGPREVLARFQQAAIERSLTSMVDLYAEDAVHEFPFTRPGVPSRLQGREQIRTFMQANWETNPLRYQAYRSVVIHETADPEVIVVEQDVTGTAATTGRDFTLPNIVVLRVRDGQIVHFRDYVNVVAVAEAAGRQLSA